MASPLDTLSLQVQYNMLRAMIQSSLLRGGSGSVSTGSTTGLSFQNLLLGCLMQAEPESGYLASNDYTAALLNGICGYRLPSVSTSAITSGSQPSAQLLRFIEAHEGYSATAYRGADIQNQTIGYGHVIMPGESFTKLTQPQAEQLLKNDLSSSIASVKKEFAGVNLSQNQFDALVSFAYNLGDNIWSHAPTLVNDIKSGASPDVLKNDFTAFDHCNGQELKGLYNRRVDEWRLFTTGICNVNV